MDSRALCLRISSIDKTLMLSTESLDSGKKKKSQEKTIIEVTKEKGECKIRRGAQLSSQLGLGSVLLSTKGIGKKRNC